jgi:hypothetical protein
MTRESLVAQDWNGVVARLGGAAALERSARGAKAFLRARVVASAADLLRLILAYCLGDRGLRSTAAWAAAMGLADISNVALLKRLRRCDDWLALLVGEALSAGAPQAAHGRLIRIIDATTVPKAGRLAKKGNKLWRIHSAFDLPGERFGFFELTDQHGGETLDRIPVVKGEIRIADRAYLQPDRIAVVLDEGADVLIRAGWRNARWLDAKGGPVDLLAEFDRAAERGLIDRPIFIGRKNGEPLAPHGWSRSRSRGRPPKRRGEGRAGRRASIVIGFPTERWRRRNGSSWRRRSRPKTSRPRMSLPSTVCAGASSSLSSA